MFSGPHYHVSCGMDGPAVWDSFVPRELPRFDRTYDSIEDAYKSFCYEIDFYYPGIMDEEDYAESYENLVEAVMSSDDDDIGLKTVRGLFIESDPLGLQLTYCDGCRRPDLN